MNLPRSRSATAPPRLSQLVDANNKNMKGRLSFIPWVLEKRVFALSFTAFRSRLLRVVWNGETEYRAAVIDDE